MTDTLERDVTSGKRAKRRRKSRWPTMLFVVLLVSLGLVATGVLPIQQYLERETQVNDAQQQLDALLDRDRDRGLAHDAETVTLAQDDVAHLRLARDDLEPSAPPRLELVDEADPGLEDGREDEGVLV